MARSLYILAVFGIVLATSVSATADQGATATSTEIQAKIYRAAEKACNEALDQDQFDGYSTIGECISDKAAQFRHARRTQSASAQAASSAH